MESMNLCHMFRCFCVQLSVIVLYVHVHRYAVTLVPCTIGMYHVPAD